MTRELRNIHLNPAGGAEDRTRIFERMSQEGRARIVQYSLPEPSLEEWLKCTDPAKAWFGILHTEPCAAQPEAGAAWITDFCGKTAFVHFVVFRGNGHLCRDMCRLTCQWAFDGGLACLLGLIPAVNRAAIAAMRASGWQEIFRIPQACYVHRLGRCVDGVLCHVTPKLFKEVLQ